MTTTTYSDTIGLPAGLGLTSPPRRRRSLSAWLHRVVLRLRISHAMSAVHADLKAMPTFVLDDIGIPASEIDRIARTARLLIVRRAIRSKLDRARRKGGRRWTS